MSKLGTIVRHVLARHGYLLTRVEPEIPPTPSVIIQGLKARANPLMSAVCCDNEVRIQSELLQAFPASRVSFWSPILPSGSGIGELNSELPTALVGPFIAVVDMDTFPLDLLQEEMPWLMNAEALLLRVRLGSFWAGELDLSRVTSQIQRFGFRLVEVLHSVCVASLQAPGDSVILVCEKSDAIRSTMSLSSRYRVNEALTYLSNPIVHRRDFQLLTGRGSFGFSGGVYNPGAIIERRQEYLLAKADQTPWALQKTDESLFFNSARPLLVSLGAEDDLVSADSLVVEGLPGPSRAEDFRLFKFHDQVFSNHTVISLPQTRPVTHRALRLDQMKTRIGISLLDLQAKRLTWCGWPTINRPLAQTEKNWVFFTDGDRLLMLYSFSPYVLLSAQNWPGMDFATIVETDLDLPFDGDGLSIRNSINPVDYDDEHWLHIVHKVYPGKQYSFWAVLISKHTLQPVQVSARPLVRGWHSASASIIYTCSAIVGVKNVRLFAGLDDSATAVATISRERLDAEWIAMALEEAQAV